MTDTEELREKAAKLLQFPISYDLNGSHFYNKLGMTVAQIRGWGYLTGVGGLNLSDDDAVEIQDAAAKYIETAINEHESIKRELAAAAERERAAVKAERLRLFNSLIGIRESPYNKTDPFEIWFDLEFSEEIHQRAIGSQP